MVKILLLVVVWPISIAAAATTVDTTSISSVLTMESLITVFLLSTLAGATALVVKLDSDLKKNDVSKNLFLFATSNMLGSWLAGIIGYILAKATSVDNVWNQLLLICLMAYTGARGLEKLSEYRLGKAIDLVSIKPQNDSFRSSTDDFGSSRRNDFGSSTKEDFSPNRKNDFGSSTDKEDDFVSSRKKEAEESLPVIPSASKPMGLHPFDNEKS